MQEKILRPWARTDWNIARPLNHSFYGYPTIAPINENEYLVTFAEQEIKNFWAIVKMENKKVRTFLSFSL